MKGHHQPVVMVKSCCILSSGSGQRSRTNWHSFQDSVFYFQVAQSFILSASAVRGSVLLRKTRRMSVDEKWLVFGRTNYLSPKCELVLWSTEAGISRKCHLKSGPSWKPHCKFDGFRSELFVHWMLKDLEIVFPVAIRFSCWELRCWRFFPFSWRICDYEESWLAGRCKKCDFHGQSRTDF